MRSVRCPCSRRPAGSGALQAGLPRSPALDPRTRLGNLRRSLAPRPAGARQTSRSLSLPEPLRSSRQIPTPEEKRAGKVRARGTGPRERGPAGAACCRVPQPGRSGPDSREQAQLLSLCLAQRSGRPVPRRPLRAQLPLSMPGAGRCPERAPPARGLCSPRAQPGPGPRAVPGGGAGSRSGRASEPGSRHPTSPASSAQLRALLALLPAPQSPPLLKGQCSLRARPRARGGGRGAVS